VSDWNQFKNVRIIQEVSAQLKLYNVGLSIDDVGALYSAIADSYKLPFEEFKLNSKLISNCAMNETKKILCMNTVSLAHDTGASVCADGVADRDEFEAVIDMKCDMVQGSWFGKPQPMEAFRANLLARNSPQKTAVNSDANSFEWPDAVSA
jgi:EAL domain-containing protein (putative c-di-GMP-specific phosphodiesterase class I)